MEEKEAENNQNSKEKTIPPNEDSVRNLWDTFKCTNVCITEVPGGEEREQEIESLCEKMMTESFPNLVKEIDIPAQEAQKVPNRMNPKRSTPRLVIITRQVKAKERLLTAAREKLAVSTRLSEKKLCMLEGTGKKHSMS